MKFVTAWMDGFRRYVQFDGRASVVGFWSFIVGNWIANIVLAGLYALTADSTFGTVIGAVAGLWFLIILLPSIAISVRRLHDRHMSGWWLLLWLTVIGAIVLIVWFALPGDPGPNRYGAQPGNHASTDGNAGAA